MKQTIIFLLIFPSCFGFAQNWEGLNTLHFNYDIRTSYQRPSDNKLYIGGAFTRNGDTILNGIAYYENGSWKPLATGLIPSYCPYPAGDIIEYNGDLYVSGVGGTVRHEVVKWNGSSFDTLATRTNGTVNSMLLYDDKLYMFGDFTEAGGLPCSGIAMWDGTNWTTLGEDIQADFTAQIFCGAFYNNELYVGGRFTAPGGLNEIAKWDGQSWLPVGNGFVGGLASVSDLLVYNGELYASGSFSYDSGANPGNYIARWDGVEWHDVGGGVAGINGYNGQIAELEIFQGELYAGGVFSYAGGVNAQYIAKWNGQEWCGFGSQFDGVIMDLGVYNNELYISGGFWTIDGDSIYHIAKWIGGDHVDTCGAIIGVEELTENDGLKIYPNPATNNIIIQTTATGKTEYSIYDVSGMLLQSGGVMQSKTIDVSGLAEGVYIIQLQTEEGVVSKKFVKRNE